MALPVFSPDLSWHAATAVGLVVGFLLTNGRKGWFTVLGFLIWSFAFMFAVFVGDAHR